MSDEDWRAFLAQWRVESSKDLTDDQLKELRHRLHDITDPRQTATGRAEADSKATDIIKWRKRVYGVIGAWLREGHYKSDAEFQSNLTDDIEANGLVGAYNHLRQNGMSATAAAIILSKVDPSYTGKEYQGDTSDDEEEEG